MIFGRPAQDYIQLGNDFKKKHSFEKNIKAEGSLLVSKSRYGAREIKIDLLHLI